MLDKSPTEKDVAVLLTFLSDASQTTASLARQHLKEILEAYPNFRHFLEHPTDPTLAREAQLFLEDSRLESIEKGFQQLMSHPDGFDLEEGAYLLARLAYPDLKRDAIRTPLDRIAETLDERFDEEEPSMSRAITLLRRYLFGELAFRGNEENYYDPDNSFLHRVLERRTGIPISLSCLYLLVCQRLDVEAYGVGLPGHFVVGHPMPAGPVFIDPFRRGQVLTRNDCVELVRQRGLTFEASFLDPTPGPHLLARMMVNLMNVYSERGMQDRAQRLAQWIPMLQSA